MISYEYPLNERIRTLLRLEDLFVKIAHFSSGTAPQDHHVALQAAQVGGAAGQCLNLEAGFGEPDHVRQDFFLLAFVPEGLLVHVGLVTRRDTAGCG